MFIKDIDWIGVVQEIPTNLPTITRFHDFYRRPPSEPSAILCRVTLENLSGQLYVA